MSKHICSVADCDVPVQSRGWCRMHYQRMASRGTTDKWSMKRPPSVCSESECSRMVYLRGFCNAHYQNMRIANASPCAESECSRGIHARGLCRGHYLALLRLENDLCQIRNCTRRAHAKSLCVAHYKKARTFNNPSCEVEGCGSQSLVRNLCGKHHKQIWTHGAIKPDNFDCGNCGVTVSRSKEGMKSSSILCQECRVLHAAGHWCMTDEEIAERDGNACAECGEPIDMSINRYDSFMCASVDHVIPRSRGGKDSPDNIALTHLICNMRKGSRTKLAEEVAA